VGTEVEGIEVEGSDVGLELEGDAVGECEIEGIDVEGRELDGIVVDGIEVEGDGVGVEQNPPSGDVYPHAWIESQA